MTRPLIVRPGPGNGAQGEPATALSVIPPVKHPAGTGSREGRRPRPTGRAVPVTPATRAEIDRYEDSLRIAGGFKVVCPPVLWEGRP